jgi:hypothetical protein
MVALHDVDPALVLERQPERQRDALDGGKLAVKRAVAFGVTGHVIEQDRRRVAATLFGEHVGDGAHLDVPMRAGDALELAKALNRVEPAAQPAIGAGNLASRERRVRHEASKFHSRKRV